MKKIFSDVELEVILLGEADLICESAEATSETTHTTDMSPIESSPVDNEDDLPWDTMQ